MSIVKRLMHKKNRKSRKMNENYLIIKRLLWRVVSKCRSDNVKVGEKVKDANGILLIGKKVERAQYLLYKR